MPSERRFRIVSHAARRAPGSNPVVGSSRKTSSGLPIRASPRSSRRFCPPESVRQRASALSVEADDVDDLRRVARARVVAAEDLEALAHGQVRVERRGLQDDPDPLAPLLRRVGRILAEDLHLAGVAVAVALEDLDRGRLSGAVRPEEAEYLAGADLEVDAADRLVGAVALPQAGHPNRCTAVPHREQGSRGSEARSRRSRRSGTAPPGR